MIITPESFRRSYESYKPLLEEMQNRAAAHLKDIADGLDAHYDGRLKSPESILSKAETSKFTNPFLDIEDLFAAVIAVPSLPDIPKVKEAVEARFEVVSIKTHRKKNPREFVYDDFHMTLKLKDDPIIRNKKILDFRFELQIKTLLQLAWWQLEHDLVYKTERLSWQKSRIFGQIKAMLELTDRMLANIDQVSGIQEEEEYEAYKLVNIVSDVLESFWPDKPSPWYDLRRASETVIDYCKIADVKLEELTGLLAQSVNQDVLKALSLTPCQAVFISLYRFKKNILLGNLDDKKLFITEEMYDFESSLGEIPETNKVLLKQAALT